jgi:uncharacterized membrane protein
MAIRKQANTKGLCSERDQKQRFSDQNCLKGKGMIITKRSKAKVWWSENDKSKFMEIRTWSKTKIWWPLRDQSQRYDDQKAIEGKCILKIKWSNIWDGDQKTIISKGMVIRKRSKAKVWWSLSFQCQKYDDQKTIKWKGMVIRKPWKANLWWSKRDQKQRYNYY